MCRECRRVNPRFERAMRRLAGYAAGKARCGPPANPAGGRVAVSEAPAVAMLLVAAWVVVWFFLR